MAQNLRIKAKDVHLWDRNMLIPPTTAPLMKGREQAETGGHALTGLSESDSNPNKRQSPSRPAQIDNEDDSKAGENQTSSLIDRSPISSETQAALLALLSVPFAETEGGSSFAELVEEATLEHSAAGETVEAFEETAESVVDDGHTPVR